MPDQRCYIFSETTGLVEHCVDLGDPVKEGQLVAKVHNIERTELPLLNISRELTAFIRVDITQV